MINSEYIENKTLDFIIKNENDFNSFKEISPRNICSPWNKICHNVYGFYEFKKAMLIRQRWFRNSKISETI